MGLLRLARVPAITISPEATVMDAIKVMVEHRVGAIVVAEGDTIAGIFTERDVMKKIVLAKLDAAKTLLSEVMTREVKAVKDSTSVREAVNIMKERQIRHLPVVDAAGALRGIVALRYLLYDIAEDLEQTAESLENYMGADGSGG